MEFRNLTIILTLFLIACNHTTSEDSPDKTADRKIRKQVMAVAEKYISGQLTNPERNESKNGLITFQDSQKKYILQPAMVYTGLIDEDLTRDAIVSVMVFQGKYQTESEQLIILKRDKEFVLASAIESDMRIISLKDRIITADVPEHSRNNPLFSCESCWEVVKYQFKTGELVRIE